MLTDKLNKLYFDLLIKTTTWTSLRRRRRQFKKVKTLCVYTYSGSNQKQSDLWTCSSTIFILLSVLRRPRPNAYTSFYDCIYVCRVVYVQVAREMPWKTNKPQALRRASLSLFSFAHFAFCVLFTLFWQRAHEMQFLSFLHSRDRY